MDWVDVNCLCWVVSAMQDVDIDMFLECLPMLI